MITLVDKRIDSSSLLNLNDQVAELFLMPPADYLQKGVSSHPDMLVFIGFGKLFCHKRYFESNRELIESIAKSSGLEISLSDEETCEKYPFDVLFNAALVGKNLICNKKTVSRLILKAAEDADFNTIHVPQGYTKCSTCIVSDNAIITADRSIYEACKCNCIDALLISEGHISLPDYNYGFIGGASGTLGDKIYFCGDILTHPDGNKISEFCKKHGKSSISLSHGELFDVGSILFI